MAILCCVAKKQLPRHTPAQDLLMQLSASPVGANIPSSFYINLTHTRCTYSALCTRTPNPLSPQKGSLVNLSDALYATSTMDLRSRYIKRFARVPLHLNYKLLVVDCPVSVPCTLCTNKNNFYYIQVVNFLPVAGQYWIRPEAPMPQSTYI